MSISEIFDHGAPHPFANLRINTLKTDNGIIEFNGRIVDSSGNVSSTILTTLTTIPTSSNTITFLAIYLWAYCTAGPDTNTTSAQRVLVKINNVGGVLTVSTVNSVFVNAFATNLLVNTSGTNILVQVTPPVGDTIRWNFYIKEFFDNI